MLRAVSEEKRDDYGICRNRPVRSSLFSDSHILGESETTKTDSGGRRNSSSGIQCHSAGIRWILHQMLVECAPALWAWQDKK
ncbi:hypothetical protein DSO57_1003268 [Entomophthora muscae]|uniref:Uncharacterized protein n=1 Tax=Entomophthora muscae TaxID=34485 RepID=A0ACC2SL72_9FUNG|nr:hypothetical protein DSO57_1003268 [Entomophthora muscae]